MVRAEVCNGHGSPGRPRRERRTGNGVDGERHLARKRQQLVARAKQSVERLRKRYLSEEELRRLAHYQNSGSDLSLTYRYVLSPVYARLVNVLPMWLAPNAITLIGLGLVLLSHVAVMNVACGDGWRGIANLAGWRGNARAALGGARTAWGVDADVPAKQLLFGVAAKCQDTLTARLLYAFAALALALYQVLDNLDGRQARRTGSSSPLGHLFDHGCDALNTTMTGLTLLAVCQVGATFWAAFILLFMGMFPFFMATLEEYFTGSLVLREINGPNEGLLVMQLMQLATAVFGTRFWTRLLVIPLAPASSTRTSWRLPQWLVRVLGGGGFLDVALQSPACAPYRERLLTGRALALPVNRLLVLVSVVVVIPTVAINIADIVQHGRRPRHHHLVARRRHAFRKSIEYSMPFYVMAVAMLGWPLASPEVLLRHGITFFWLCGLTFFYIVSRLILAHLTCATFGSAFPALAPLALGFLNALLGAPVNETLVVHAAFVSVLVANARRVLGLIDEICAYLRIRAFRISPPEGEQKRRLGQRERSIEL
ncbi:hypothetical protein CDCA_CDCA06G1984 [Cyanidium caldarium]|uniref:Ethanolaminephosphotransferase n=1 Tax=Cyanidium caldarium TaxID=2771 RepID=A0AAV9IUM9_CYACA|nr:hypothetical protein CDCA_CDCA06G1984 [Cyanidium caldarium]